MCLLDILFGFHYKSPLNILQLNSCMGVDVRKFLFDKVSTKENVFGVDLRQEFIDAGYVLFEDKERMSENFFTVDLLKEDFVGVLEKNSGSSKFDVVYLGSVFHLLNLPECTLLANRVFQITSNDGFFFGRTMGYIDGENRTASWSGEDRFLLSKKGLQELLEQSGFKQVQVTESELDQPHYNPGEEQLRSMLSFSGFKRD